MDPPEWIRSTAFVIRIRREGEGLRGYGASTVRMEPRAETFILPYGAHLDGVAPNEWPWVHVAAGRVDEGSLIADDWVQIGDRAALQVAHSAETRALPGVMVLDPGRLTAGRGARLDVHGLVYAARVFDVIYGAQVHIVGSVIAADPVIGFNNLAATVVIRYDPAVLGTPGLRVPAGTPVVAWVSMWEDVGP